MNDDLISRQAILESIERISVKGNVLDDDWVYRFIQEFPSAHQWIPCSERLPEEGKEVLISSDSGLYIAELEILEGNVYWNETIEYRSVKRVSAWCPLPEPYKGGEQDG